MKQDRPDLDEAKIKLGLVTNGAVGWKTLRRRWEHDLADYAPTLHHIEDYCRGVSALTERYGAKSVGHGLAGRSAASAAIRAGARVVLMTTLQNAPLAPLRKGVRYIIYGDATASQLATLYGGKTMGFPGSLIGRRFGALVAHGATFLCASDWFRRALREELGSVADDRLLVAPLYIDTDKWTPLENKTPSARLQLLFIGGDLKRKGADVVYALARREAFRNVDFHIVSPEAVPQDDNVHAHRDMKPETPELRRLVAQCDIYMQPTRADMSSLAAMEAASCGLPAIITNVGGIPEIVRDGVTGAVLPAANVDLFAKALSAYIANPHLVAEQGRAARAHVIANFSRDAHMSVLREAIARANAEALEEARAGFGLALTTSAPALNQTNG